MLKVVGISKRYKNKKVIENFSLGLDPTSVSALIGPNGAGKSTLFNIFAGALQVDSGEVYFNNMNITYMPMYERAKIGLAYLTQEGSIIPSLDVFSNILAVVELHERDKDIQHDIVNSLLGEFNIAHLINSKCGTLSGGERRRVEIARCIAMRPQYLLLDEPFAGIDPISISDFKKIVMYLAHKKIGILITDHSYYDVLGIASQIYIVNMGKIVASGSPSEIVVDPTALSVYLGDGYNQHISQQNFDY